MTNSPCEKGKVYNPKTGRCVAKTGKIGKEIMGTKNKKQVNKRSRSRPRSRSRRSKNEKGTLPSRPATANLRSIYEKCDWKKVWKKKGKLGGGAAGSVYTACDENNCEYILKIQKDNDEFRREIKILSKLSGWKHGPKVYGSWSCKNKGYIIEEKLKEVDYSDSQLYEKLKKILKELHNNYRISFPDIHEGNVMMRENGTVVLIDFGWAEYFKPTQKNLNSDNWLNWKLNRSVTINEMSIWEMQNLAYTYGNKEQKNTANINMKKLLSKG